MQDPELYEIQNKLQKKDNKKFIKKYFKLIKWKDEESVIDIGCGTGNVTVDILLPKLPKNIKRLVGIDVCDKMIEFASKNNPKKKVEYITLDIETKELPEEFKEQFDHAFSFYCLHWVQNQSHGIQSINKLLKPGGGLFANILAKHPFFDIYEKMAHDDKWSIYTADYKKFATPYQNIDNPHEVIKQYLEENGFKVILCETKFKEYRYGDDISVKSFIASINPFISRMPEELIYDYLDEFIIRLQQYNKNIVTSFYSNYTLFHRLVELYAIKE